MSLRALCAPRPALLLVLAGLVGGVPSAEAAGGAADPHLGVSLGVTPAALAARSSGSKAAAPGEPTAVVVAVVVGSNQSPSKTQPDLRYADDDAIQNARTMALLGATTLLLVSPDAESRELHSGVAPRARATRSALIAAFDEAFAALARAQRLGRPTRFYFFFAGHGDVADGQPFLQMDDGRLWRTDLLHLLQRSPASENHLVVDACYASLFVGSRGPGGERSPLPAGFSRGPGPAWPKSTGLLTAHSSGGKTHEWTEFQGGVFSHEVRSGILGAADADLDGRVTYRELAAFVTRANAAIVNRKFRPQMVTAPPWEKMDAVFAVLPEGPLTLEIDRDAGRSFVQSGNGVRLVDLHPAPGTRLKLRLPTDLGPLFLHDLRQGTEWRVEPTAGQVLLSALTPSPAEAQARGAAHEAFLLLFDRPFDRATVETYRPPPDLILDGAVPEVDPGPRLPRWAPWVTAGVGAAAALTGVGLGLSAHGLADQAAAGSGLDRQRMAPDIEARNRAATFTLVGGLVTLGAGLLWGALADGGSP